MRRYLTRDPIALVAALAAPLGAAVILLPFRASWSNTNVALLLVVVVVGVAAAGNRVAGGLAAVSAAVWFDFFFTVPYERFAIHSSSDVTTAVLLLVVGLAVSQLAAWARRLHLTVITDAGDLALIRETASLAEQANSADVVADHVREQLIGPLDLEGCRFEPGSPPAHPARLAPDGSVMTEYQWDIERWGLPAGPVELRVYGAGQDYGRFMVKPKPGSQPSLQARLVAVTLADQAGRAFGAGENAPAVRRRASRATHRQ